MPQSLASVPLHIIFSTKNRQPFLNGEWTGKVNDYFGGIALERKCVLLAAGGMPDHVHLLVSLGREITIANLIRDLKSATSRMIHETIPGQSAFAWQSGYGVFGVSQSNLAAVLNYIRHQAEHHRSRTFQEEFREFLDRHQIAFDERYVWD